MNRKGDLIWQKIVMYLLAVIILAIVLYMIFTSKNGVNRVGQEISGYLS